MDEMTLLRLLRPEVAEPAPQAWARARARLATRAAQSSHDRADGHRSAPAPAASGRRRTTYRALGLGAVAASVAAVLVAVPLTGQEVPAEAAVLLSRASDQVAATGGPTGGDYLKVTTRSDGLAYVTAASGEVRGAYVNRTAEDVYVPTDPAQEWVSVSYTLPPGTTYGSPAVAAQAREEYAAAATAEDPTTSRAVGGAFGNGELGGQQVGYATTAELGSLSRDPDELLEDLAARTDGASGTSRGVRVMTQVATLLGSGLVDPGLTATMYRTLALLPEVVVAEQQAALDGRRGTAFGIEDDEGFAIIEVIIDLDDGTMLGVRSRQLDAEGPVPAGTTVWSTAVSAEPSRQAP